MSCAAAEWNATSSVEERQMDAQYVENGENSATTISDCYGVIDICDDDDDDDNDDEAGGNERRSNRVISTHDAQAAFEVEIDDEESCFLSAETQDDDRIPMRDDAGSTVGYSDDANYPSDERIYDDEDDDDEDSIFNELDGGNATELLSPAEETMSLPVIYEDDDDEPEPELEPESEHLLEYHSQAAAETVNLLLPGLQPVAALDCTNFVDFDEFNLCLNNVLTVDNDDGDDVDVQMDVGLVTGGSSASINVIDSRGGTHLSGRQQATTTTTTTAKRHWDQKRIVDVISDDSSVGDGNTSRSPQPIEDLVNIVQLNNDLDLCLHSPALSLVTEADVGSLDDNDDDVDNDNESLLSPQIGMSSSSGRMDGMDAVSHETRGSSKGMNMFE